MFVEYYNGEIKLVENAPAKEDWLEGQFFYPKPEQWKPEYKHLWTANPDTGDLTFDHEVYFIVENGEIVGEGIEIDGVTLVGTKVKAPEGYVFGNRDKWSLDENGLVVPYYPKTINRREARLKMLKIIVDPATDLSMLEAFEDQIAAITDRKQRLAVQAQYEADTWNINDPFVISTWLAFGRNLEDLRQTFREAALGI